METPLSNITVDRSDDLQDKWASKEWSWDCSTIWIKDTMNGHEYVYSWHSVIRVSIEKGV